MEDVADAVVGSWSIQFWPTVGLVLLGFFYFRGWLRLRKQVPHRFDGWRLASFLGGVATIFLALGSPLDTFANLLLQAHMVQHLLLMMIAPPLLLLANPFLPLLTGIPRPIVREAIRPFLLWSVFKRLGRWLTHPKFTWILFVVMTLGWHAPRCTSSPYGRQRGTSLSMLVFCHRAYFFGGRSFNPGPAVRIGPN